jgi:hypothetical protein
VHLERGVWRSGGVKESLERGGRHVGGAEEHQALLAQMARDGRGWAPSHVVHRVTYLLSRSGSGGARGAARSSGRKRCASQGAAVMMT